MNHRQAQTQLGWRIITTGDDADGRALFRSDRSLRVDDARGPVRTARVLTVNVPATSVDDGDPEAGQLVTGPGSLTVDALVVEPTASSLVDPPEDPSGSFEALTVWPASCTWPSGATK